VQIRSEYRLQTADYEHTTRGIHFHSVLEQCATVCQHLRSVCVCARVCVGVTRYFARPLNQFKKLLGAQSKGLANASVPRVGDESPRAMCPKVDGSAGIHS